MAVETLEELFHEGIRDIYYAEKQILRALTQMAKKANSDDLRQAFETHKDQSEKQIERLEQVFEMMEAKPRAKKCPSIEGIIAEGKEHMDEIEDEQVLDAALIGDAQAVEHYEITRYGTLIAWARRLGNDKAADLLAETLEEEEKTDALLTELAESQVNEEAMGSEEGEEESESEEGSGRSKKGRSRRSA